MRTKFESMILESILIYLICYFMDLLRFPNFLMLILGAFYCFFFVLKQRGLRIDVGVCLLGFAMFSYCLIRFGIRALTAMMPYTPVVIYVLANYLAQDIRLQEEKNMKLVYVIYTLVFGHAVHGILNSYMFFKGYGWEGSRYWMDVWTREVTPGTQLTMYYLAIFAIFLPAIIYFFRRKWANILVVLGTLFFVYASLATKTRTTLLVLAIVFCGQVVLYAILEWEKLKKNISLKKVVVFWGSIIVVGLVLLFAFKDTEIVRAFIDNLGKDGGIINNARFKSQALALEQLFDYPWGGCQMELETIYAHNVWLDMANAAGLIPFFAFTAYTVWTAVELLRFLFRKEIDTELKLMMAGLYVAFFLYYTVEPALDSSIHFITPWILINGLIHGCISDCGFRIKEKTQDVLSD